MMKNTTSVMVRAKSQFNENNMADHIDKALAFLESTQKLGEQLIAAENQQKFMISRMLDLKKAEATDSDEYAQLDSRSKSLQAMIDKYRPLYLERMEMIKEVKKSHDKR